MNKLKLVLLLAVAICLSATAPAMAGVANQGLPSAQGTAQADDPIADMVWANYTGTLDDVWPSYEAASGTAKSELAEVAQRPEAYWFGGWNPNPEGAAQNYIEHVQNGNRDVLVQMSDFSLSPWEDKSCTEPQSAAMVRQNQQWNSQFARGIGSTRALVVLEPDLGVVQGACMTQADRSAVYSEISYAARTLSALPYTTVYIAAGSSDWLSVSSATSMLISSGIRDVRGFALDATHFASTQSEILYGAAIVQALAARGVNGVHFIVDTAENGHPFTQQAYARQGGRMGSAWASRPPCVTGQQIPFCQTFGIPPTWKTALATWRLGATASQIAARLVDGYVWFGRPWMKGQSSPFDPSLTEAMAASTPYPYPQFATPVPG